MADIKSGGDVGNHFHLRVRNFSTKYYRKEIFINNIKSRKI